MRGFSDEERDRIREELIQTGREMFLQYGPEKTNVAEITEPVGIAKSTFYRFFDTKSELYLAVFLRERDEFLDQVRTDLAEVDDAETGIVRLLDAYLSWIEGSPLLQQMIDQWEHEPAFGSVSDETLYRHQQEAIAELIPFIEEWKANGEMRDIDQEVFFGLMGAVGLMTLHHEEFEDYREGMYDTVRGLMIEALAYWCTNGIEDE
ncbi:TetR/AcrR family transcriptional regulator [Natrinema gelatinilyticum]|uniref:TetR/AcrR family transcriptional regulator n=1 Tax=Natrinema gelatinilyticum TaxID=2961571 RepID=UPI0020C35E89|nr:TetR/AcrR family transcriptional regulator [Natrinema gelatinilyticum]